MRVRTERQRETENDLTAEDWAALYFVWKLFGEVAVHGKPALDRFLKAFAR